MFTGALKIVACTLITGLSAPFYADNDDLLELEIADLAFMREEKKMAGDVYAELYQYYKARGIELIILANITLSGQKHMDAMLSLLEKYQLEDSAAGLERGEFENTVLAHLYENLVPDSEAKQTSLDEAVAGVKVSPEAALYTRGLDRRARYDRYPACDRKHQPAVRLTRASARICEAPGRR